MDTKKEEVFRTLRSMLAGMLGVEEAKIRLDSSLVDDLGMESLDLLDLAFQLEEKFGIPVDPAEFSGRAAGQEGIFEADGRTFTPLGLEKMIGYLPQVPPEKFVKGLRSVDLPALLTVAVFVDLVLDKQAQKGTQ